MSLRAMYRMVRGVAIYLFRARSVSSEIERLLRRRLLAMTSRLFPFSRFTVHGNSMLPTLKPGQDVLCFNWAYLFFQPKVGDIVVMKHQGKEMAKRIYYILGREYFVQGDNGKESIDSRSFGTISKSQLIGKIIWY